MDTKDLNEAGWKQREMSDQMNQGGEKCICLEDNKMTQAFCPVHTPSAPSESFDKLKAQKDSLLKGERRRIIEQIRAEVKGEIKLAWKRALKKRNGTTQGHIDCVEYFDNIINLLT